MGQEAPHCQNPHLDFVGATLAAHTLLNIEVFSHLPKTQSK